MTYRQRVGTSEKLFVGHFTNPADPTFQLDSKNGISRSTADPKLEVAEPISSGCTANPFSGDGSACQGGAPGKAFFLFNDGPQRRSEDLRQGLPLGHGTVRRLRVG